MHEFDLAQKIFENVSQELASRKVDKVNRIKINVGKNLFAEREGLKESFNLIAKGSVAEDAELEITQMGDLSEISIEEIEAQTI